MSTFVYSLAGLATVTLVSWFAFDASRADPLGVAALSVAMAVCLVCG